MKIVFLHYLTTKMSRSYVINLGDILQAQKKIYFVDNVSIITMALEVIVA